MKENTVLVLFLIVGIAAVAGTLYHSSQVKKECESRGGTYYRMKCFHPGMP